MSKALAAIHGWKQTTILSWDGPLPQVGDYLMSARPRWAYRIMVITPARPGLKHTAKAWLERVKPADVSEKAVVHDWMWSRRDQ